MESNGRGAGERGIPIKVGIPIIPYSHITSSVPKFLDLQQPEVRERANPWPLPALIEILHVRLYSPLSKSISGPGNSKIIIKWYGFLSHMIF